MVLRKKLSPMPMTIGEYLISRLRAHGVEHVFGIPGDYVLGFFTRYQAPAW